MFRIYKNSVTTLIKAPNKIAVFVSKRRIITSLANNDVINNKMSAMN